MYHKTKPVGLVFETNKYLSDNRKKTMFTYNEIEFHWKDPDKDLTDPPGSDLEKYLKWLTVRDCVR